VQVTKPFRARSAPQLAIFVLAADVVLGSAFAMLLALLADLTIPHSTQFGHARRWINRTRRENAAARDVTGKSMRFASDGDGTLPYEPGTRYKL
jgi:hypothetical protein